MSGPVTGAADDPIVATPGAAPPAPEPEVRTSRVAQVGGTEVRRALPQRERRTVGAWCFADHFGPSDGGLMSIGPHPHIGLQTVTWLLDGELLHRDSLGSEQLIRPGQLNLMTAGDGVAHAEEADGTTRRVGHGTQLWVALPEGTRGGPAAFEHHAELPDVDLDGAVATVLVGELAGVRSPARADTRHVGFQLAVHGDARLALDPTFEHAVIPLDGPGTVGPAPLDVGQVAYFAPGHDELVVRAEPGSRLLVLGGEPWDEAVVMWWNFVARSRDELAHAYRRWQDRSDRFGPPVASALDRIDAPRPHWLPKR